MVLAARDETALARIVAELAERHPGTVPAVLNFSGFLADHPTVAATPETVKGTPLSDCR